ncbi:tRNA pseudouridine32 synthase / 23S rRNA pseudouridine746 synthase [Brevibacterium jeotgali]|uniref:RNA pseudouridylate synthase n=2 Tax=Brevibacterium jeotgali TaxID=1262550 RepID=A0A2H1L5X0_9MICO|nr:tRNA pseudouridine32 synthase/23S rRNA pseudouridine746 synthase [Brevibacterium jeotgali]SMY12311.1 tRNA pseudouridine32 synthase / 23S rRNA pseudouridine746 synthase [Brevibacterium jeotgali]
MHARMHQPVPPSVGAWLRADFPDASEDEILDLTATRELTADDGSRVSLDDPVIPGGFYWFHRSVPPEERVPVEIGIVHEDEHLLVVDKPHFLASTPNGRFVRECVVTRMRVERDDPDLVAIHRLDRVTAGLLLLSKRPETRGAYQTLFQNRRIRKTYRALAALPPAPGAESAGDAGRGLAQETTVAEVPPGWAACRATLLHKESGDRQVREVPGPPNSRTEARLVRILEEADLPIAPASATPRIGEFELTPHTGRTHQLRVHMQGWGMPILGDPVYPVDLGPDPYDLSSPLQLLAHRLEFRDPLTGEGRVFDSRLTLVPTRSQLEK